MATGRHTTPARTGVFKGNTRHRARSLRRKFPLTGMQYLPIAPPARRNLQAMMVTQLLKHVVLEHPRSSLAIKRNVSTMFHLCRTKFQHMLERTQRVLARTPASAKSTAHVNPQERRSCLRNLPQLELCLDLGPQLLSVRVAEQVPSWNNSLLLHTVITIQHP